MAISCIYRFVFTVEDGTVVVGLCIPNYVYVARFFTTTIPRWSPIREIVAAAGAISESHCVINRKHRLHQVQY